jgi:hypothetical protein
MAENDTDHTATPDEAQLTEELGRLVASIERSIAPVEIPSEAAFVRRRRARARKRAAVGSLAIAVCAVALAVGLSVGGPQTVRTPNTVPVLEVAPSTNLDIVSNQTQVSVNLASGDIEHSSGVVSSAASAASIAMGIHRRGFIAGIGQGYVSVSDDLQTVLHTWTGRYGTYGAPAANPSNLWISDPYGTPSTATEVNGNEVAVGPSVAIPRGTIVSAQIGSDLVLENNGNGNGNETLELWNPASGRVIVNYGAYDQVAASVSRFAWTTGNSIHIVNTGGKAGPTVIGPAGDWAKDVVFSPDGSRVAVLWGPAPGSLPAASIRETQLASEVEIVEGTDGSASTVPNSSGATGPIAWMPDGSRIFFGQIGHDGSSLAIATFALGSSSSEQLAIPDVQLPANFSSSTSGLFIWSK